MEGEKEEKEEVEEDEEEEVDEEEEEEDILLNVSISLPFLLCFFNYLISPKYRL